MFISIDNSIRMKSVSNREWEPDYRAKWFRYELF